MSRHPYANHAFVAGYRPRSPAELTAITFATARGEVNAEALSIWLRQRTRRREGF